MATAKTKPTKPAAPAKKAEGEPRHVKDAKYKSFSLQKKITQVGPSLPSAWAIFKQAVGMVRRHPKLFLGIAAWFGIINFVFVQGLTPGADLSNTESAISDLMNGNFGQIAAGFASFAYLVSAAGGSPDTSGSSYQLVWTIIVSLALIWTFRQLHAGRIPRIRDGFYQGMYPLIPTILVLLVIALQSIPMIIGTTLLSTVLANGIAATGIEVFVWTILCALLVMLSLYMMSSSVFALYIVGLPETTPMSALRSARQLSANRRWAVIRKALFLPFILLVVWGLIMVPLILLIPAIAVWIFFIITMINVVIAHSYYYALYRSLL